MNAVKVNNLGRFLDDFDIQDISHAYHVAYLKEKGVAINNQVPATDRQWNFGPLIEPDELEYDNQNYQYPGSGYIIRSQDDALFCLSARSALTSASHNIEAQIIGANLHEAYLDIIVHLIAQHHEQLPCNKIRVAIPVNHEDTHWTLLMANFEHLNLAEYHELYKNYWAFAEKTGENRTGAGVPVSTTVLKNNIKNFILKSKEIGLTETQHVNENGHLIRSVLLPCWTLPVGAEKTTLKHYDSSGTATRCAQRTLAATQKFIKENNATTLYAKCASQDGNTCGDWTQYNAFRYGVVQLPLSIPCSQGLRFTHENLSIENAHQILFANNRQLIQCAPACAVHPFRDVNHMEHQNQRLQTHNRLDYNVEREDEHDDDIHEQFAEYPWLFNDTFPKAYWASRILLSVICAHLTLTMLPTLFVASSFVYSALAIANATLFFFNFDSLTQSIFGKQEVHCDLDKNKNLYVSNVDERLNLLSWMKVAPYRTKLDTLEKKLELKLCVQQQKQHPNFTRAKCRQRAHVLAHYYLHRCVLEHKNYFYDQDKEKVLEPNYVNNKKAKQYARA